MIAPVISENETERLKNLYALELSPSEVQDRFDRVTRRASGSFPAAGNWFAGDSRRQGFDLRGAPELYLSCWRVPDSARAFQPLFPDDVPRSG